MSNSSEIPNGEEFTIKNSYGEPITLRSNIIYVGIDIPNNDNTELNYLDKNTGNFYVKENNEWILKTNFYNGEVPESIVPIINNSMIKTVIYTEVSDEPILIPSIPDNLLQTNEDVYKMEITLCSGGGGGAGGSNTYGGGGGGSGAQYTVVILKDLSNNTTNYKNTYYYQIGKGGKGGSANNNGEDGGETSLLILKETQTTPEKYATVSVGKGGQGSTGGDGMFSGGGGAGAIPGKAGVSYYNETKNYIKYGTGIDGTTISGGNGGFGSLGEVNVLGGGGGGGLYGGSGITNGLYGCGGAGGTGLTSGTNGGDGYVVVSYYSVNL